LELSSAVDSPMDDFSAISLDTSDIHQTEKQHPHINPKPSTLVNKLFFQDKDNSNTKENATLKSNGMSWDAHGTFFINELLSE
jgi:hypothetical protein